MTTDNMSMLNELQSLLKKQLKLAHQGNSAGEQIEVMGKQADILVRKIAQQGILEQPEFESQKNKLQKLYEDLHLALTAQKAETNEQISHVRSGRRIVETYRKNI